MLYSSTGSYLREDQTATLSEAISAQPHGIVLVFSRYDTSDGAAYEDNFTYFFIPKAHVSLHNGKGVRLGSIGVDGQMMKYIYVSDTVLTGHSSNNDTGTIDGITYANNEWVLREVIGV